jgi:hypothetical protein
MLPFRMVELISSCGTEIISQGHAGSTWLGTTLVPLLQAEHTVSVHDACMKGESLSGPGFIISLVGAIHSPARLLCELSNWTSLSRMGVFPGQVRACRDVTSRQLRWSRGT